MPRPLTVSCFSKIQICLHFWYWLTGVVPDKVPLNVCVCVISEVSVEDQQKIDQFMQNQQHQQRGRRRMPTAVRPLALLRPPLRLIRPSPQRSAFLQPRPLFHPRMGGRMPLRFGRGAFGTGGFGTGGFGTGAFGSGGSGASGFATRGFGASFGPRSGIGRGNMTPAGGMPPRRKILVNPHFRGSSSVTQMVHGPAPSMSSASAAVPRLKRDGVPCQPQQPQPQFTV